MARPNVILITVDAMGWNDFGTTADTDLRTPNLDALVSYGLRFTQATSPPPPEAADVDTPVYAPQQRPLDPLLMSLRAAQYQIGAVGVVTAAAEHVDVYLPTGGTPETDQYLRWIQEERAPLSPGVHDDETPDEAHHRTTWTGNQAVRFCQAADEPFFLWAGFQSTTPPPAPWNRMYAAEKHPAAAPAQSSNNPSEVWAQRAAYYGALSHMDRQIGRMLATLTARGRTNNVFVFTANRGASTPTETQDGAPIAPLHDGALRVPLIVGGLLGQRKGAHDPALLVPEDLPATLLEALQIPAIHPHEGRSFLPQLHHSGAAHRAAVTIPGPAGLQAIRTARYKWIRNTTSDEEWVFNLQTDPAERQNLTHTRQAVAIRKMLTGLT